GRLAVFRDRLLGVAGVDQHVASREMRGGGFGTAGPDQGQCEHCCTRHRAREDNGGFPWEKAVPHAGGSVSTNVAPGGPSRNRSVPPCACAISRLVERPRPLPPGR